MRVIRGRGPDREADRAVTTAMLHGAGNTDEPAFHAWMPHRQLALGRRDTCVPRCDEAVTAAEEYGFPAVECSAGGHMVAYAGTTVAFAHAVPLDDTWSGLDAWYEAGATAVAHAPRTLGVPARRDEPPASYCPSDYSVQAGGRLRSLTQHVRKEGALVSGAVVVTDRDEIADVLVPVHEAIGVPLSPDSVGNVANAGGSASPSVVCDTLEAVSAGDAEARTRDMVDLA